MGKSTTANMRRNDGELTVQHHETDSPILPVAQLKQLHTFKPDAVDWMIKQTQIEAEYRREEDKRYNNRVFIEKVIGQVFALIIGLAGIIGGSYVAIKGQPAAGGTIASLAITGLAGIFLTGKMKK